MRGKIITLKQLYADVPQLCAEQIEFERHLRSALNFDEESADVRLVATRALRESYVRALWCFTTVVMITGQDDQFRQFTRLTDNHLITSTVAGFQMTEFLRRALVTRVHFHLDYLFSDVAEHIDKRKRSILKNAKTICSFLDESCDDLQSLRALSSIRNSYHSNGIHHHPSFIHSIQNDELGEVEFRFEQNEAVSNDYLNIKMLIHHLIRMTMRWFRCTRPPLDTEIVNAGAAAISGM
jgi:hypothetical protein